MSIREERGTSAVEFAIVSSVLFLVLFGIVQFGIAFNQFQGVQASAREGARTASLSATTVDEIRQRVKDSVSIIAPANLASSCPGALAVNTGCIQVEQPPGTVISAGTAQPCNLHAGQDVKVSVKYQAQIVIPLWATPSITLTGDGSFQCE